MPFSYSCLTTTLSSNLISISCKAFEIQVHTHCYYFHTSHAFFLIHSKLDSPSHCPLKLFQPRWSVTSHLFALFPKTAGIWSSEIKSSGEDNGWYRDIWTAKNVREEREIKLWTFYKREGRKEEDWEAKESVDLKKTSGILKNLFKQANQANPGTLWSHEIEVEKRTNQIFHLLANLRFARRGQQRHRHQSLPSLEEGWWVRKCFLPLWLEFMQGFHYPYPYLF